MQKLVAFLLILFFSLHLAGDLITFNVQRYHIRREMRREIAAGIPADELTQIRVSNELVSQLGWEFTDEFKYNGMWYDVVARKPQGAHHTVFYCLKDSDETRLYARYAQHFKDAKNTKKHRHVSSKISFKYLPRQNYFSTQELATTLENALLPFFRSSGYRSPHLEITSPPPQQIG